MPTHTDKTYEAELRGLREKLLAMGARVEVAISSSVRALVERDTELARKVEDEDANINRAEVEIDDSCRRLLALRQPAGSDLRFITTALKIVTDLERMGDLAVNIAERVVALNEAPQLKPYGDLVKLADLAQGQLKRALDAFVDANPDAAQAVLAGDDLVDALYLKVFNELVALMLEDSKNIRRAMGLMFVAKHLERLADHVTNVGEMVIYMVKGTDVRHPHSRGLDQR